MNIELGKTGNEATLTNFESPSWNFSGETEESPSRERFGSMHC